MRRHAIGFFALMFASVVLWMGAHIKSQQPPTERSPRGDRPQTKGDKKGKARLGPAGVGRGGFPGGPGGFMRIEPLLKTLDADGNGEISKKEIDNAYQALKSLDKNKDGKLTFEEVRPAFGGGPGGFPFPGRRRGFNPFGGGDPNAKPLAPEKLKFQDGVAKILDHATFQKLSYKGPEVMIDWFLAGLEFIKFTIIGVDSKSPTLYFMNTKTHRAHMMFARVAGLPFGGRDQMKGVLVYRPMLKSPSGKPGLYTFEFEPFDAFPHDRIKKAQDLLIEKMPLLKGNIGYYPRGERAVAKHKQEKEIYKKSDVFVYLDKDLNKKDIGYLPLNMAETFGRLRLMKLDERPSPRDVVLYRSLPNEMPRVAGIITGLPQTPLSHVNLRAVQDKVPNAFITNAENNETIKPLFGKYVFFKVTADGFTMRAATSAEVESHFASRRPKKTQAPTRDLSVKTIQSLRGIKFQDWPSYGRKIANHATLLTLKFPKDTVPEGHAIPFYFYDEFMKHNGFYDYARELLKNPKFQADRDTQIAELKKLRKLIRKGRMPLWMMQELDKLHKSFPKGTSLRCRSSTNNEDLAGFSGAGLYSSYSHHPREGHFSKSVKQVFASLWNYRAFDERDFYRVDHFAVNMAVLVHPSFKNEKANGVAVTDDILYQTEGNYYVNVQVGEDLVTNPDEESIPEEILLDWYKSSKDQFMRTSNRVKNGKKILSAQHLNQLRDYLGKIHAKFAKLFGKSLEEKYFAMEIEFKITSDGRLVIKQARPWVFPPPIKRQGT